MSLSGHEGPDAVTEIEGYLLWQAELDGARRAADAFADRLPWLTSGQRDDVVRVYTADHLETARARIRRIAGRAMEIRGQYEARYRELRARVVALAVVGVAGAAMAGVVAGVLTR